MLHPVNDLAVLFFLNGDVGHGGGGRSAVPVLLAGREPDYVAGANFLNRALPALGPAATGRDNESLAEGMRVPGRARSRLESYAGALHQGRIGRLKERVDAYGAGEPVGRPLGGRLRAGSFDFHLLNSFGCNLVWHCIQSGGASCQEKPMLGILAD